ncbi:MAG TPA: MFS transporter [Acidimicrobiales bacterium]|jgi:EmrB/QacA subfamily drug resistance transporter|nr:MFS transporter [Acidimicrobiales bacterium]
MDAETIYARRWWTLAVLCFSLLVIGLDNTILNVALPTLVRDLHASQTQLQWIVDAYTIVYASLLLTTGSMGDKYGRKGALSVGLVVFGFGSLASAFSGSATMLIAARGLAGIGGCIIMPATLSILTNVFPASERGKAIGIWAGVSGLGIVVGPTVGGWLLQHFWWGSVFLVNVPVVITALIAGHFLIPTSRDPGQRRLDPMGTVLATSGLVGVLYGLIEGPDSGWASPGVLTGLIAGAILVALFVVWELHSDHPMLDVRFFQNPRFSAASISVTLIFFAMFGCLFFLTQYLQSVLGYSALRAGLGFIPLAAGLMIAAPSSAKLTARFGTKLVVAVGMAVTACALVLLSQVTVHSSYLLIGIMVAVLGVGIGTAMSPATESIMGSLPLAKAGVGSAVNDTTRQVGGALGVAILGSITNSMYRSSVASSKAISALPASARAVVRNGIGNALGVAQQVPSKVAAAGIAADAKAAFVHAMTSTAVIGAVFALAGAAVALVWLPARPKPEPELGVEDLPADELEPVVLVD